MYPGIRPALKREEPIYHTYYQWVWVVLLIQSVAFYFPHWIWEKLEGGTVNLLVGDLNLPMMADEQKNKFREKIVLYLKNNRGHHNKYAIEHLLCEILNLIHILAEIFLTDYFLGNAFTTYGLEVCTIFGEHSF